MRALLFSILFVTQAAFKRRHHPPRVRLSRALLSRGLPGADFDLFVPTKICWLRTSPSNLREWKAMQPTQVDRHAAERKQHPERGFENGYLASQGVGFFHGAMANWISTGRFFTTSGKRFKGNGTFLNATGDRRWAATSAAPEKVPYKVHLNEFVKGQKLEKSRRSISGITSPTRVP